MTNRIQIILKSLNLSPSRFADEIDVQRSGVSHILSGRNKPSLDFITKILSSYPEINADWLLFGKGTMIKKRDQMLAKKKEEENAQEREEIETLSYPVKDDPDLKLTSAKVSDDLRQDKQAIEKIIIFFQNNTFKVYKSSD